MILYSDKQGSIEPIEDIDFQHLGEQLQKFVDVYRKNVLFTTQNDSHVLNTLEEIARCIKCRDYFDLLNDPSIISPDT